MNKIGNTEAISRRKALALVGLGAVLGLAAATVSVSEAEAQTVGMQRRQGRRTGRRLAAQTAQPDAITEAAEGSA